MFIPMAVASTFPTASESVLKPDTGQNQNVRRRNDTARAASVQYVKPGFIFGVHKVVNHFKVTLRLTVFE